jgi:hypothetical protein
MRMISRGSLSRLTTPGETRALHACPPVSHPTPNIDRIIGEGFLAPVWIEDGTPTVSGPCWHDIRGNDFAGNRLAGHPDFLTVLTHDFGLPPELRHVRVGRQGVRLSGLSYLEIFAMSTTCPGGGGFSVTGVP